MFVTQRRNTPLPKAIERVANAVGESVSATGQVVLSAAKFVFGQIRPYQGLHNFVHSFYDALATNGPMPVSLEDAREVVRWTEQLARDADYAKEKFYRAYQPTGKPAVVVTGANGNLGRALVNRLLKENQSVRLFVRRLPAPEILHHPQVEVVLGELGEPGIVDAALKGATAVYHVGAAMGGGWATHEAGTIAGTRNVVGACLKHNVPKLIYVSSLSVIDWAGHPVYQPVTESSPLEPHPTERGFYTQAKLEAERIVRAAVEERKLPAVIVRPGKIWSETGPLIDAAVAIRLGNRFVMIGDDLIQLPLVHVDDVVEGLLLAGKFSGGEIFHLVDKDSMSREELARLYTLAREPQLKTTHVSMGFACFLARGVELLGKVLKHNVPITPYRLKSAYVPLAFDCTKAREQLGWRPQVSSSKGLRAMLGKSIR
jgi:nucleoside-diphosphate-sugar epimerase